MTSSLAIVPLLCVCFVNATEIVQWGDSTSGGSRPGPTNPPPGLTNVVALTAGNFHSLALTGEGKVVAWGYNNNGQTNVPSDLSNVVAFAAGTFHNLAVTGDGRVTAWGWNAAGQASVPINLSNVVQVAAGEEHSLALRADGTVVAWGKYVTNVPVALTNCITIASSAFVGFGITADGRVTAWGNSSQTALTNVPAGLSNVVSITGGRDQCIALMSSGMILTWGYADAEMTNLVQQWTNVLAISLERLWALALLADGQVVAGGAIPLDYGQTNVPSGLSNVVMIANGRYHGLALTDSNSAGYTWRLPQPQLTTNGVAVDLPTQRGRLYVLEKSPSLNPSSWTVEQRIAGDGTVRRLLVPPQAAGFYRARRVP